MSRHPSKHHAILGLDEDVKLHSLPVAKPSKKEGSLNFSDYFSDEVPYDVKPVPSVTPMEETDWPIQARNMVPSIKAMSLKKLVKTIAEEMLKRKRN